VFAKVSGNVGAHKNELDGIWEAFGADRLIYASNWPVSNKYASYPEVLRVVQDYFSGKGQAAVDGYFWKNAQKAYRWVER
jgi:predicted TIM-barrel fold metal-dependent hydrolase